MWAVEDAAKTVAALLSSEMQELPTEILNLDDDTAAIVVEVDGVDYILIMSRVPAQRPRMASN
jgi:hypothetical protein